MAEPYKAYLDETNIHDSAEWCFIAGHLGTEQQWKDFDQKWREGLGKRKGLHMCELRWKSKPDRIKRLLEKLGPIPDSCKLERIFGSVRGAHYLDLVAQEPAGSRIHSDPYTLALWPCVIQTLRHLPRTERIIFTLEQNINYLPVLRLLEDSMKGNELFTTPDGEHRAFFVPVPKGATPRTEAADYLAFEMGQMQIDKNSFKAIAGAAIMGDYWMIGKQISRQEIRSIVAVSTAMARQKTTIEMTLGNALKMVNKP